MNRYVKTYKLLLFNIKKLGVYFIKIYILSNVLVTIYIVTCL